MNRDLSREAFERWYNAEYVRPIIPADRTEGGYQHPDAQSAWDAWQAALSHAEGEVVDKEGLADALYLAGYSAARKERDYDPRGCDQWQAVVDAISAHPAPQLAGLTETAIKSSPAYRKLHREKDHLLGLLKEQAPQVAMPEGYALVPEDMLTHFRDFHDAVRTLSKTADPDGYWEHQCEVCKRIESQLAAAPTVKESLTVTPTAPAGELVTRCTAGLGCDEKGYCDAAATGQGDLCDRRTMAHEQPASDPDGFEQVLEELRSLHAEMTNADLVGEGNPEIVGYCVTGKQLDRMDWLLTCCASAGLNSAPAPDERDQRIAVLEQFMADASDDMECPPECDSLAHSDQCPVAHTDQAFRVLRERIAALEAALRPFAENGMAVSAAARTIARALLTQEEGGAR